MVSLPSTPIPYPTPIPYLTSVLQDTLDGASKACYADQVNDLAMSMDNNEDEFAWRPVKHKPGGKCNCSPLKPSSTQSFSGLLPPLSEEDSGLGSVRIPSNLARTPAGPAAPPPATKEEDYHKRLSFLDSLKAVDGEAYAKQAKRLAKEIFDDEEECDEGTAQKPQKVPRQAEELAGGAKNNGKISSRSLSRPFGQSTRLTFAKPKELMDSDWACVHVKLDFKSDVTGDVKTVKVFNKVEGHEREKPLGADEFEVEMFKPNAEGKMGVIKPDQKQKFDKFMGAYSGIKDFEADWVRGDEDPFHECLICKPIPGPGHSIGTRAVKVFNVRVRASMTPGEDVGDKRRKHNANGSNDEAPKPFHVLSTFYSEALEHCKHKCHYYGAAYMVKATFQSELQGWHIVVHQRKSPTIILCI